jgi:hypothetical protein
MTGTGAPGPNLGFTTGWTDHDDHWGDALNASGLLADTVVMCAVESIGLVTPPTGVIGKRYVVGVSATGAWSGKDAQVAVFYQSAWVFYPAKVGWRIYNKADNKLYLYGTSAVWTNEMSTGYSPFAGQTAWTTSTAYTAGPPASYITINASSYICLVAHTSGTFATDLAAGKWGIVALAGAANSIYDLSIFVQGQPVIGQHIYSVVQARPTQMAANLAGSVGRTNTNPTGTPAFDIKKRTAGVSTTCATVSISSSGVFTFTTVAGAAINFAAGDSIEIFAPLAFDATMADIAFTLALIRL